MKHAHLLASFTYRPDVLLNQFLCLSDWKPLDEELVNELKQQLNQKKSHHFALIPDWKMIILFSSTEKWYMFPINDQSFGSFIYKECFY